MVKKERCPHRPKLGHRSFKNPATWDCMTIIAYRPIFGNTKFGGIYDTLENRSHQ